MNLKVYKHPRIEKRIVVKFDVTNATATLMGARGQSMRAATINAIISVMFPRATAVEIVYHYAKRGVSNAGFKAAVWVDVP